MMNIYSVTILTSLLIYAIVGGYVGRKVKDLDDYIVTGRNAPTLLIVGTLIASTVSTGSFIGDTGFAYEGYTTSQVFGFVPIAVLGFILGGLFFGRYLRRSRAYTLGEFFGERFASTRVRMIAALTIVTGLSAYLLAVNQGVAIVIAEVTGISYRYSLISAWLGYSAFTVYGGSRGVVITDTIMFLFFTAVAYVGLSYIVTESGGWFATMEGLAAFAPNPEIVSAAGRSGPDTPWETSADLWVWALILGVSWGIAYAISPWQASRYLMAKNEHVTIRSACLATCILAVTWPLVYYSGAAVALINPDIIAPENPVIWSAINIMPPLIGALLLGGIVAAGLSSASTFLSLIGFAISNDLIRYQSNDQRKLLRVSRASILATGVVVLVIAVNVPPAVFWISQFAGPMFASCWGPIAFASVWSKKVTEPAAFWGMIAGLVGVLTTKAGSLLGLLNLPTFLDPILLGAAFSSLTIVVVSMRTKVTEAEERYRVRLHEAPSELSDHVASHVTSVWPKVTIGFGGLSILLMTIFYVRPYQIGAGIIDRSHPFVAWSGETFLAISFGLLISGGGWIALRASRHFLRVDKQT